jgi:hypothetical protein
MKKWVFNRKEKENIKSLAADKQSNNHKYLMTKLFPNPI